MKNFCMRAWAFASVLAITLSVSTSNAFALTENGFTYLEITHDPECYAEITIEGDHFTIDGRAVNDPVNTVRLSSDHVEMTNYEFNPGEDYTFHAEFDAAFEDEWTYLCFVNDSKLMMTYRVEHDENGWYFPDNGLAELNAGKLEHIQTAVPEAAAYYISQTADEEEIEETLAELQRIVEEVCGDEQEDYKKAFLIYRWVSENIYYDKDAAATEVTLDTVAIHNVLERRRTTCAGYSNTYCAMLEIAGIRSVNLKGAAATGTILYEELPTVGENHEFTAFWYEEESRWAYVDPTWGSTGRYEDGEYSCDYPSVDRYFDVSGEALALNHRVDKVEERHYTTVLNTEEETEETTTEPLENEETESTTTKATTTQPSVTTKPEEAAQSGNFVIYIIIGAAGVIIVITGIILATRKK